MLQFAPCSARPTPRPAFFDHHLDPAQLRRLRERLLQLRQEAQQWIEESRGELMVQQGAADEMDRAATESHFETSLHKLRQRAELLTAVGEALRRMEEGSYGYCEDSGEPIGIERLLAYPCATLSVEAQTERERKGRLRSSIAPSARLA